jgi:hypothetical protein
MDDLYKQLGFKQPKLLRNPLGIRIYIGTEGKDDWCIVIPRKLVKLKNPLYPLDQDYAFYLISEQEALSIAKEYTELANRARRYGDWEA